MSRTDLKRLTWYILGLGAVLVASVYAKAGAVSGSSAAIGLAVAIANWFLLRYIVGRVVDGGVRKKAAFSFVLFVKLGGLMALVFVLLYSGLVTPIAFAVGVSSLPLGALLGSFTHVLTAQPTESER